MPRITFAEGIEVYYRGIYGKVDFVCENYITVCVRRFEHKSRNVCVLIYPNQYKEIELFSQSTK